MDSVELKKKILALPPEKLREAADAMEELALSCTQLYPENPVVAQKFLRNAAQYRQLAIQKDKQV